MRDNASERGQTLVIFALVLSFFLVWMIALVADVGTLYVAYDRFDNAALLAAQAGASAIDTGQLYQGNLRLDVGQRDPGHQREAFENVFPVHGLCDFDSVRLPIPVSRSQ